jgi:hypothetical protein
LFLHHRDGEIQEDLHPQIQELVVVVVVLVVQDLVRQLVVVLAVPVVRAELELDTLLEDLPFIMLAAVVVLEEINLLDYNQQQPLLVVVVEEVLEMETLFQRLLPKVV